MFHLEKINKFHSILSQRVIKNAWFLYARLKFQYQFNKKVFTLSQYKMSSVSSFKQFLIGSKATTMQQYKIWFYKTRTKYFIIIGHYLFRIGSQYSSIETICDTFQINEEKEMNEFNCTAVWQQNWILYENDEFICVVHIKIYIFRKQIGCVMCESAIWLSLKCCAHTSTYTHTHQHSIFAF